MLTINGLYEKVKAVNTDKVIDTAFQNSVSDLGEINKVQLFDGKGNDGQNLTPSYFDDPYFKSRESAQRYSDWKDKITPNPKRQSGTPNLFINGKYYDSRSVFLRGQNIVYDATFKGIEIEGKYAGKVDGLGGDYKKQFLDESLRQNFNKEISAATGLKFGK